MMVNLITERQATYLRRRNDIFDISGCSLAGQFWTCCTQIVAGGPVVQVVANCSAL